MKNEKPSVREENKEWLADKLTVIAQALQVFDIFGAYHMNKQARNQTSSPGTLTHEEFTDAERLSVFADGVQPFDPLAAYRLRKRAHNPTRMPSR